MANKSRTSILIISFALLFPVTILFAGSQAEGWSPEELALAKELGLDVTPKLGGFGLRPIGEQTWLSPWVVEGTVQRIDTDPYGFYHTKVSFHVSRYFKGNGAPDITLRFISGPAYSERYGMVEGHEIPGVNFKSEDVGRRFILFMSRGRLIRPGQGVIHPRGDNEFSVHNRYLIAQNIAQPDRKLNPSAKSYPYGEVVAQILRVAVP